MTQELQGPDEEMKAIELDRVKKLLLSDDSEMIELGFSILKYANKRDLYSIHCWAMAMAKATKMDRSKNFYEWYRFFSIDRELTKRTWA